MAATCNFDEYNGAGSTQAASITNLNFGACDGPNIDIAIGSAWITAGSASYEKYIKAAFTGTFNYIGSLFFWASGAVMVAGETITMYSGTVGPAYATPVATTSAVALTNVVSGTSPPTWCNVHLKNSYAGSLTAVGSSNYIVLQTQTTTSTPAGNTNSKTFKLQWTEA